MASDISRYYIPSIVPLVYCAACLKVALKKSKKAKDIYDLIVKSYREPGMQDALKKLQSSLPGGKEAFGIYKDECHKGAERARKAGRKWMPDATFFSRFITRIVGGRLSWLWLNWRLGRNPDLKRLMSMWDDLIKAAFNREDSQEKGVYKITIKSSPMLVQAVLIKTLIDYLGWALEENGGKATLRMGSKYLDLNAFMPQNRASRHGRAWTQAFTDAKYRLLHDEKIAKVAERWYACRVEYAGINEYLDALAVAPKNREVLDLANVSNEIKECDLAMGYPRSKSASK